MNFRWVSSAQYWILICPMPSIHSYFDCSGFGLAGFGWSPRFFYFCTLQAFPFFFVVLPLVVFSILLSFTSQPAITIFFSISIPILSFAWFLLSAFLFIQILFSFFPYPIFLFSFVPFIIFSFSPHLLFSYSDSFQLSVLVFALPILSFSFLITAFFSITVSSPILIFVSQPRLPCALQVHFLSTGCGQPIFYVTSFIFC